ncbi:MAG TPA: hypothetical protein PKJ52_03265 [Rectinema sp.]|jgi:hypothetical protein|nr:hypothetical protein [Rectinema sp.]
MDNTMIQKRIIKTTTNPSNEHELAKSAEQILNDYRDTVVKVIRCYLNKQSCDELSCYSASISKKLVQNNNNGTLKLSYIGLLKPLRINHNGSIVTRARGWYFFLEKVSGRLDYIGVGGIVKGELNKDNDLFHRITQHFGTSTGATFYKNFKREKNNKQTRKQWVSTLSKNYELVVVFRENDKFSPDELLVVESVLVKLLQPKYNL